MTMTLLLFSCRAVFSLRARLLAFACALLARVAALGFAFAFAEALPFVGMLEECQGLTVARQVASGAAPKRLRTSEDDHDMHDNEDVVLKKK